MNMHIDQEELQRQYRAHKLRQERLGGIARRQAWADPCLVIEEAAPPILTVPAIVPTPTLRPEAPEPAYHDHGFDLHVSAWQKAMWEKPPGDMRPTVGKIVAAVSEFYGVPKIELLAHRRLRAYAKARQVAMYLSRTLTEKSLPVIGAAIGGRDHSTIDHGVKKITRLIEEGDGVAAEVEAISLKLIGGDDANATRA